MKPSRLFFAYFLAALLVAAVAFGLDALATHVSPLAACGAGLVLFTLPASFRAPDHTFGVAAAAPRNTDTRPGSHVYLPLAANTKIYQGTLVARDADGRAVPASATAGLRVIGKALETIDNTGGAAGALSINVEIGCFKFANSADNAITAAMLGRMAVVEDDQTVASTAANLVAAGRITGVDADGVWIDTREAFYGPRTVPALTSTDGTMAAAADDAATKAEGEKIGDDVRALHSSFFG